jgi:hypothetical protein
MTRTQHVIDTKLQGKIKFDFWIRLMLVMFSQFLINRNVDRFQGLKFIFWSSLSLCLSVSLSLSPSMYSFQTSSVFVSRTLIDNNSGSSGCCFLLTRKSRFRFWTKCCLMIIHIRGNYSTQCWLCRLNREILTILTLLELG